MPNPPVDMIRVTGAGVLEDYLVKETKPFYEVGGGSSGGLIEGIKKLFKT